MNALTQQKINIEIIKCSADLALVRHHLDKSFASMQKTLADSGRLIRIPSAESWTRFTKLASDQQIKIAKKIADYADLLVGMIESEIDLKNESQVAHYVLKKRNLHIYDSFYKTLKPGQVVEMYSLDMVQFFRNFTFLEITDYDLLDIESMEWTELFDRHQSINEKIMQTGHVVYNHSKDTHFFDIGKHFTQEKLTKSQQLLEVEHLAASLIFDENENKVGFVVSQMVNKFNKNSSNFKFLR